MIIFACDLDNTLISSKKVADDDICVELIENRQHSFISRKAHSLLISLMNKVTFIPVTTRSVEQYQRIHLFDNNIITPYAIMCHGGKMLKDDIVFSAKWQKATNVLIDDAKSELEKALTVLIQDEQCEKTRWVNDTFIFTKSQDPSSTAEILKTTLDLSKVTISYHGKKLYVFPKELNKGMAIEQLKNMFNPSMIIGAGDSVMDIDMLNKVDIAYTPTADLCNKLSNKNAFALSAHNDFTYNLLKKICEIVL